MPKNKNSGDKLTTLSKLLITVLIVAVVYFCIKVLIPSAYPVQPIPQEFQVPWGAILFVSGVTILVIGMFVLRHESASRPDQIDMSEFTDIHDVVIPVIGKVGLPQVQITTKFVVVMVGAETLFNKETAEGSTASYRLEYGIANQLAAIVISYKEKPVY